jgi:hypothetical protein
MARRTEKLLTDVAEPLATKLAHRYGNLKIILSGGILALDKLTPAERERMIDEANGIIPDDPSQEAAESARICVKKMQSLDAKQYAIALQFLPAEESRAIREMLEVLNPEKRIKKSRTG